MVLEYDNMVAHVQYLAKLFHGCNCECVITLLLIKLQIPTKHGGFDYVRCAISLYYADPAQIDVYGLYTAVARNFSGVSEAQVERLIRRVIQLAWSKRAKSEWSSFFPYEDTCPSNTDFISMMGRVMEMWRGCCEKYENIEAKEGQLV